MLGTSRSTSVGNKKNRQWLIYAYHRESGEIVAFVWGKRNLKTANMLRAKLLTLGVTFVQTIGTMKNYCYLHNTKVVLHCLISKFLIQHTF